MRQLIPPPHVLWTTLGIAVLAGCATVGPNFTKPEPQAPEGYTRDALPAATVSASGALGAAQSFATGSTVAPDWWRQFGSARLDALIARALAGSPTLAAAEATLRQAQQVYAAQAGSTLYPTVNAKLGASRSETNAASVGQKGNASNIYELYNAGVAVNYNLDLFGGNRRALEALAAQADYQRFQLAGAKLTLAANVAATAFSQAQLAAQIDATEAILEAQLAQLDIARKRFELGAVAKSEVLSLQTQVEQTRATLPPLRNRLQQVGHLLAVLAGEAPGAADIPGFTLAEFTLPARLPVVVPSELLRQRPDIQASTALLHAATAQYGVAVSSLYPQINLSASLGSAALSPGALFGPGSMVWSLAGQLAQPLFNAGLRAGANAAEASLQAAGANYQQTVLQALRNVADALRALENDARTLQAQDAANASAQEALQLVEQQYRMGATSYLQLLTAQQQAQQTRIGLIAAQAQRLADSAALYQAMGGGVLGATDKQAGNAAAVAAASAIRRTAAQ
ncbi:MAG: efflux transporter outer membrane subunit [Burkholderiales bacterium]|nr:efflux transporter outer membrane subunit [Burkholderiales bacterium]